MAVRPFNSVAGFSTGDPAYTVIQANGDITTVNFTANGISNVGNVGNLKILGGSNGQYLQTDGSGNLIWDSVANITSNNAGPMPYYIATGESYIINENKQGLYSEVITIDGEFVIDGMLIEISDTIQSTDNQVLFDFNGTATGNTGFEFQYWSGNLSIPGNLNVTGNILPGADDTYDLGRANARWRNGYFGGNTIYLDTATISVDANGFVVIRNELGGTFRVEGTEETSTTEIENGTSNVKVYLNGNVATTVSGIANVLVVTTAGANLTGNLTATGVKTDNLYYANGNPWDLSNPGGSNTQIQFNNNGDFGASANLAFDPSTNNLSIAGNIVTSTGALYGNGAGLTNIAGGNVTGQVANATVAGTVYTNAQPNITSVGTLTSLDVSGNVVANGVKTDNLYYANGNPWDLQQPAGSNTQLQFNNNDSFGASANLTFNNSTNVLELAGTLKANGIDITGSGNIGNANVISANYLVSNSGCVSINGGIVAFNSATGAAGVFSSLATNINLGLSANIVMGGSSANVTVQGNLIANGTISTAGNISANLITGTLTTAAQPNVTSLGTLTSLNVTGNVTSNIANANTVTTNSIVSKRSNIAVITDTIIDSFPVSQYRSAKYVVRSSSDLGYESLEVLLIHNNINSYITVYAAINDGGGNTVSITTGVSSGNVELRATGLSTNTKINLIGTYVPD